LSELLALRSALHLARPVRKVLFRYGLWANRRLGCLVKYCYMEPTSRQPVCAGMRLGVLIARSVVGRIAVLHDVIFDCNLDILAVTET